MKIEIRNLCKSYDGNPVLENFSLAASMLIAMAAAVVLGMML